MKVWESQDITDVMRDAIEITAKVVFDSIMTPMAGISNISEWCKEGSLLGSLSTEVRRIKVFTV
jgi:hypothetical protein